MLALCNSYSYNHCICCLIVQVEAEIEKGEERRNSNVQENMKMDGIIMNIRLKSAFQAPLESVEHEEKRCSAFFMLYLQGPCLASICHATSDAVSRLALSSLGMEPWMSRYEVLVWSEGIEIIPLHQTRWDECWWNVMFPRPTINSDEHVLCLLLAW